MKKFFISLNFIILAYFFTMNSFCCGEEFFLDDYFGVNNIINSQNQGLGDLEKKIEENYKALEKRLEESKKTNNQTNTNLAKEETKPSLKEKIEQKQEEVVKETKEEKEGFFSRLFKKKKKDDEEKKGYYGQLPNIYRDFRYKKQTNKAPIQEEYKVPTLEELNSEIDAEKLKQAPIQDALFLDNIFKKEDKPSEYIKDLQKTKFALTNLKKCIEEQGDIQRFNACVNMINLYVSNLEAKYKDKSDALKESYREIVNVNYHSKVLGNLLYDSNYYAQYIPVQNGKYSQENIENEKQKLLIKINKTLFSINQES